MSSTKPVLLPRIITGVFLLLAAAMPLRAAPIVVDGTGHNIGPLPLMIYDLARTSTNTILPNNSQPLYLFGIFDTGSTLVAVKTQGGAFSDTSLLGISTPSNNTAADIQARTLEVRINGLQTIGPPPGNGAPIGSPGFAAPQAFVPGIVVGPRDVPITLIGAPVANQVVALFDYTTPVVRGPYPFSVPDAGPNGNSDNLVEGRAITFFNQGAAGIPTPEIQLSLERFGSTNPSLGDGASNGFRYLLRNVAFAEGAATLNDQGTSSLRFFYDSGTTPTIISRDMAISLGLTEGAGTFQCFGVANSGYVLDSVAMTGTGGTYTVNNASVCADWTGNFIDTLIAPGKEADAIIGSNLFDQVAVLFDGPGDRLGIGTSTSQVPLPATLLLLLAALPGLIVGLRRRARLQ